MNDERLLGLRASILWRYDEYGRMVCRNEPGGNPAPRLHLGYTREKVLLRFGATVPTGTTDRIAKVFGEARVCPDLHVPSPLSDTLERILEEEAPVVAEDSGPVYRFRERVRSDTAAVQVTRENLAVVRDTFPWLQKELADRWPCFAVVRDGAAVSICLSSRVGAGANEAGVETHLAFRGRGFASAVTSAWSAAVVAQGKIPFYSTSWTNVASQGVANRLGLIVFGGEATWV